MSFAEKSGVREDMQNYYCLLKNIAALTIIAFIIAPVDFNDREIPLIIVQDTVATEPVEFDFDHIKQRGSIRIVTSYNVGSYFLHGGMDRGFEYDFFAGFARKHSLSPEVVVLQPGEDPIEVVNRGDADIIADNFINTPGRSERVYFSEPYRLIDKHLILSDRLRDIDTLRDIGNIPITIRQNSAQHEALLALSKIGYTFNINLVPAIVDEEAILLGVAQGEYYATIADNQLYDAKKTYMTGLKLGPVISPNMYVSWGVRSNASRLQHEVDKYIYGNFKHNTNDNDIWKSGFLTILENRYFNNELQISQYRRDIHDLLYYGQMSPYDDLIRPAADAVNVDWKLALAVIAQESSFRPDAVSFAGAVGLMQIIPRFSLVSDQDKLMDPKTNIQEGMRYLNKHLSHYSYLDRENQIALTLATYNAGMGHVADARRLVIDSNKDPNNWDDIAEALLKLMDRRYHRNARYGYVRGTETVDYVQKVMAKYKTYQAIAQLPNGSDRELIEETILAMGKLTDNMERP